MTFHDFSCCFKGSEAMVRRDLRLEARDLWRKVGEVAAQPDDRSEPLLVSMLQGGEGPRALRGDET